MGVWDKLKDILRFPKAKLSKETPRRREALVLFFGVGSVTAAVVDLSSSAPKILQQSEGLLDAALSEEEKIKALAVVLGALGRKHYPPVCMTWYEGVTFRQLAMPDMPAKDLLQAFAWDLKKKYFYESDENFLGYSVLATVTGEDGPEKLYNLFYLDKKIVQARLNLTSALGLDVRSIVPAPGSVSAAIKALELCSKPKEADILACDLSEGVARVIVTQQGKPSFVRQVTVLPPGHPWSQEAFVKLSEELHKSLDFYAGQKIAHPIEAAVMSGQDFDEAPLKAVLEQQLQVPVKFLRQAVLIGSPLVGEETMNLLPETVKKEHRDRRVHGGLKKGFWALVFLLTLGVVWILFGIQLMKSRLESIEKESVELLKVEKVLVDFTAKERVRRAALRGDLPHGALLKELSRRMPSHVVVREMSFERTGQELYISGVVDAVGKENVGVLTQFVASLSELPFFKNVALVESTQETDTEKFKFGIRGTLRGIE